MFLNTPRTLEDLRTLLIKYNIDVDAWDKHIPEIDVKLFNDLKNEEVFLKDENGSLLREMTLSVVDVYYITPEVKLLLKEDRQEILLPDGSIKTIKRVAPHSVSEKVETGEDAIGAARRGINEELKISSDKYSISFIKNETKIEDSPWFIGLKTQFHFHIFEVHLKKEAYISSGYIDVSEREKTYFVWEKVQ